ncbi:MAG TPA: peptide deformylase [Candidatus Saccharimonadales bacterium]|nr:peptide deformylase [Candidatus Saccharimonadales bacterium]
MSIKKTHFVAPNDPVLIKIAQEVPDITASKTKITIRKILDIAHGNRKNRSKPTVVGLAAPQIGVSQRIIAVDVGADGYGRLSDMRVYLNPVIIVESVRKEEWCEGCWSTDRVCGVVNRSLQITLQAYTPTGEKVEETYSGYVARIFQHEIDHLNGIEFVNRVTDASKLHWVEKDEWIDYKTNEGWREWHNICPRERWEKIKGIRF